MPHYKNPFEKGDLLVRFKVTFPKSISPSSIEQLRMLLPNPSEPIISDDEVYTLEPLGERNRRSENSMHEDHEPQGVRCQAQ